MTNSSTGTKLFIYRTIEEGKFLAAGEKIIALLEPTHVYCGPLKRLLKGTFCCLNFHKYFKVSTSNKLIWHLILVIYDLKYCLFNA